MAQTRQIAVVLIAGGFALDSLTSVVHAQPTADATVVPAFQPGHRGTSRQRPGRAPQLAHVLRELLCPALQRS